MSVGLTEMHQSLICDRLDPLSKKAGMAPMPMGEILKVFVAKAKTEAEEAQRE